jgi:hypothetical protein
MTMKRTQLHFDEAIAKILSTISREKGTSIDTRKLD